MNDVQWKTSTSIGKNISKVRKELDITQEKLAEQLGISRRALSSYECGEAALPVSLVPKLSEIFSIPTDQLLNVKSRLFSLDERTRKAKLLRKLEKINDLSREEQKIIFNMIDSLADKQTVS